MSASLPQSIALAGLLWLLISGAIAIVVSSRRAGPPRLRAVLLPAVGAIGATTVVTWAGHALAGTRGVAVGVMLLLFAILALFARLHAVNRWRAVDAGDSPREPSRSVGVRSSLRLPLARGHSSR